MGVSVTEPEGRGGEVARALDVARGLARVGVPVFLAYPSAEHRTGYVPAAGWQHSPADPAVVDAWRPGMALCLLTGCGLDLVDLDPRNRPEHLGARLEIELPDTWAMAYTPSGGVHHLVPPIGESSLDGKVEPGVDVKSGRPDGSGRGFAFIAPTTRRSKVDGVERAYSWVIEPDPDRLVREWAALSWDRPHPSTREIADRMRAVRGARRHDPATPRVVPASVAAREWTAALTRLRDDVAAWAATGWGGEAHAGLLAATTHLARLDPEHAEEGFSWAFEAAGVEPDDDDLAKLESAIDDTTPDVVISDLELARRDGWQALFWQGAEVPEALLPREEPPPFPATLRLTVTENATAPDAEGAGPGRFRFLDEHEVERIPEPDRLIDGLLWTSTVARLFGASGAGKTWVALDMAAHVATGTPWQGRAVRRTPTLFVAAEGAPGLGLRMRAWRSRHGRDTGVMTWPEPITVGGPDWDDFASAVAEGGFGYVLLDTQAAMTVGYNENSNSDAAMVLRALGAVVRLTGACVMLVHHVGHDEVDRARGATGMFGGLDTELRLVESRRDGTLTLHQDKQKYAERGRPTRLRLERHGEGLVVAAGIDEAVVELDRARQRDQVEAHVAALQAAGIDSAKSLRALTSYLRDDLGRAGDEKVMRDAIRLFKARAGVSGVVVADYLRDAASLAG